MRHSLLLIPAVMLLSATTLASQRLAAPSARFPGLGVPADTGDSTPGKPAHSRAALQCPMPVQRPDREAAVPMPTGREQPSRVAIGPMGEVAPGLSAMPVARADCWNPLDRPQGEPGSLLIDSILPGP